MGFNYGRLVLAIDDLVLYLENCDFNPDSKLFGYSREINDSFLPNVEYNIYGNSTLKQSYSEMGKYTFELDLQLNSAKLALLSLMHRKQIQALSNSSNLSLITLNDERLAIAEQTGYFSRPVVLSANSLPNIQLPAGYEWYYPQFQIILQGDTINTAEALMLMNSNGDDWLYNLTVTAKEA